MIPRQRRLEVFLVMLAFLVGCNSEPSEQSSVSPPVAEAIPWLYDIATLNNVSVGLEAKVRAIIKEKIEPMVSDEQKAILENVHCNITPDNTLFNLDSDARESTLNLPASSVKFLSDLCYLEAVSDVSKFRLSPLIKTYIYILKYRHPSDFPNGRFPTPFEFYQFPCSALQEPMYGNAAVDQEYHVLFDGALLFLLGHEAHHLISGDFGIGGTAVTQEMAADDFGVSVLERNHTDRKSTRLNSSH